MWTRSALLTALALTSFAANSILCRMALGGGSIDAASFAAIRLASGAIALIWLIAVPKRKVPWQLGGDWVSATMLLIYAVAFAFAYVNLPTGTGALILFGFVQITMVGIGMVRGEHPHVVEFLGMLIALGGLAYLVSPGLRAPSPVGAVLMAIAGCAWGIYSVRGRNAPHAAGATTGNFVRTVPLALMIWLLFRDNLRLEGSGVALAIVSGAVTSGLGYVLWYAALPGLSSTRAAVVQLAVPVITAVGGTALLSEIIDVRMVASSALTLGGVALAVAGKTKFDQRHSIEV